MKHRRVGCFSIFILNHYVSDPCVLRVSITRILKPSRQMFVGRRKPLYDVTHPQIIINNNSKIIKLRSLIWKYIVIPISVIPFSWFLIAKYLQISVKNYNYHIFRSYSFLAILTPAGLWPFSLCANPLNFFLFPNHPLM